MDGWNNGWMERWIDIMMDRWRKGGRMDGWNDGWTDGWMEGGRVAVACKKEIVQREKLRQRGWERDGGKEEEDQCEGEG